MISRVFTLAVAAVVIALAVAGGLLGVSRDRQTPATAAMATRGLSGRFEWVDVYVKADQWKLGAWQVEITASQGRVAFVGVEGGDGAFADAPAYDSAALSGGERLVIGAANIKEVMTAAGRVRVARVHVQAIDADVRYVATLTAAADENGTRREATVELITGDASKP